MYKKEEAEDKRLEFQVLPFLNPLKSQKKKNLKYSSLMKFLSS